MSTELAVEDDSANHSQKLKADLCMFCVAAIWGINMPIMKFALVRVDAFLFNATRLLISALVLAVIVWHQKATILNRNSQASTWQQQMVRIGVFAFLTGFAYQVLFLVGINQTSAGNTALIMSALPMWTALLATILTKEYLNRFAWSGLLVAMTGTLIVTLTVPRTGAGEGSILGNLLVAAATFSWALGSVWSRPMMKEISPIGLAFCGVALPVPLHFLVARYAWEKMPVFVSDPWLLAAVLFSGGLSTGLAYAMWNFGVKILGTSHAAIFQNLVPFFALFFSWMILAEVPGWLQVLGGCITLVGLVIMRRHRD